MTKIITVPNPILKKKSKEVELNSDTKKLIKELKETLTATEGAVKGVGLSAVQIGNPKRVFIVYSKESRRFLTFINPEIIWCSKRATNGLPDSKNKYEGCLSVPGIWAIVKRPKEIKIRYLTENGTPQVRKFAGFTATIVQHEYDHLNGVLFIQRALEQGSKIYELKKDKEDKEYLEEVEII